MLIILDIVLIILELLAEMNFLEANIGQQNPYRTQDIEEYPWVHVCRVARFQLIN